MEMFDVEFALKNQLSPDDEVDDDDGNSVVMTWTIQLRSPG